MAPEQLVREVLRGSWLQQPPPLSLAAEEFASAVPLLRETHAELLAWWHIRNTPIAETELGAELANAFRMSVLRSALQTRALVQAVQHLRAHDIEPILVKGWAVARYYPAPGLRPLGDIDLFVPKEQIPRAQALVQAQRMDVDIQRTPLFEENVFARSYEDLIQRAETCVIEGVEVRVIGAEDHLRLLCIHMLDHGAWRPLWLTDIAAALETRPASLDWERILQGPPRAAEWVLSALALAHVLLDAPLSGTPAEHAADGLPRWLVPAVLHHWSQGSAFARREPLAQLLPREWWHLPDLVRAFRLRWPDPIRASLFCRAPFDNSPRFPYQLRTALASLPLIYQQLRHPELHADL